MKRKMKNVRISVGQQTNSIIWKSWTRNTRAQHRTARAPLPDAVQNERLHPREVLPSALPETEKHSLAQAPSSQVIG